MVEPGSSQIRRPAEARGQSPIQPKEIGLGPDFSGLLVAVAIALAVSFALFGADPLAVLGVGVLIFVGMIFSLILMAFVGQLLVDAADPSWRSDFREQLSDPKGTLRAWRAFSNDSSTTYKATEGAGRREQAE